MLGKKIIVSSKDREDSVVFVHTTQIFQIEFVSCVCFGPTKHNQSHYVILHLACGAARNHLKLVLSIPVDGLSSPNV